MNNNCTEAKGKYLWISPSKLRRVADLVRGKRIREAHAILKAIPHKGARMIEKVLTSAVANASHNCGLNKESLFLKQILVDEGPRTKRFQPRARGRMYKIIKRSSHLKIGLDQVEGVK